jgi:hypothetical protein
MHASFAAFDQFNYKHHKAQMKSAVDAITEAVSGIY